jgi:hypothetical protein
VLLWSYRARAVVVFRSDTKASETAQSPASASSLPPPAPAAMSTHLMFQPVCVPLPLAPHTPEASAMAFIFVRVVPPYSESA